MRLFIVLLVLLICSPSYGATVHDGTDDAVSLTGMTLGSDWSLYAVVKRASTGTQTIFISRDLGTEGNSGAQWRFEGDEGNVQKIIRANVSEEGASDTGITDTTTIHYLGVTYDDSENQFRFYLDGATDGAPVNSSTFTHGTGTLGNKRADGFSGDPLNATIYEFAAWDAILTDAEMIAIHDSKNRMSPLQVQPSNLLGYYTLDDEEDGTSGDGDTFYDQSSNRNDGTGDDGNNNTGLTSAADPELSYP